MNSRNSLLSVAASAAILATASMAAQAVSLNGTFGFIPAGALSANTATLNTATSITVPAFEAVNTYGSAGTPMGSAYLGKPNDFYPGHAVGLAPLSPITLSETTIANGTYLDISWMVAGDTYTFTAGPPPITLSGGVTAFSYTSAFSEQGTISDSLGNYVPGPAQLSASFTQDKGTGAINGSFTFSTPPPPKVITPEPGNVAMLMGMGLSGAGFLVRRRRSK